MARHWMSGCMVLLFLVMILPASTLHLSIGSSPARVNPLLATDSASSAVSDWIFNGLVKFDPNAQIVGDLAKRFYFEDNKTLVFELRQDVRWHDGMPFSAEDVLYTYTLLQSPRLVTPYKDDFKYIERVEKLDSYRVRVTYTQPYFKALSIWMMGIVPKHIWEQEEDPMTSAYNRQPIGTGPYRLPKPFKVNERITLEANSDYFVHTPHIQRVALHYIPDPSTQFITLKARQLDIGGLGPLEVERQIDDAFGAYYQLVEQPSESYTYLGFNLKDPKFQDRRVREAIGLAIDKQEIIDLLFFSHGTICRGPFMPASHVYPHAYRPPGHDPERSRRLLKALGFSEANPLRFELVTNTGNDTRIYAAQIIQHQLRKVGIQMRIRTMEWQAFLNTVVMPRQFESVLLGWSLSLVPDAYSIWHSDAQKSGGFNFVGYHNPEVDRLIVEAEQMVDPEAFAHNYQEIFRHIVEDYPYVFLYIPNTLTAVNRAIAPIEPSVIGIRHNQIDWVKHDATSRMQE
jgi:peptide/nickel transport system substrate-binding protein